MSTDPKPYAESCDENRDPILAVLEPLLADCRHLLEVGSGTGQHAVYFAARLPHLTWQTSDLMENLPGIRLWLAEAGLPNLPPPLHLAVTESWPAGPYDAAFTANTIHIIGDPEVAALFAGIGQVLTPGAPFALYGPFNYGGAYTSESNARFDAWLKTRDPRSGIKDRDTLVALAQANGLTLSDDHPMPCNNRILVFRRLGRGGVDDTRSAAV
jgi:cyclopropane fatty-acyl-phospholipid synthase-like methyltransferase